VIPPADHEQVGGRVRTGLERAATVDVMHLKLAGRTADLAAVPGSLERGGTGTAPLASVPARTLRAFLCALPPIPAGPPVLVAVDCLTGRMTGWLVTTRGASPEGLSRSRYLTGVIRKVGRRD
jgi:hypothetical protein